MALLPNASVAIDDTAGAFGGGTGYAIVLAAVALSADITPRVFASTTGLLAQHGYNQGVDYSSLHFEGTKQPIIFVGLPIVTAGTVGRQNSAGVLGTSVVSIAAGPQGFLEETDASVVVQNPGTLGVSGITFNLSLDGGKTTKLIRLGTASSYTVPYVGIVINFGAGTLLANDTYTFSTTAPMWDSAGITAARLALAGQLKLARSIMVIGDIQNSTFAGYITTELNNYETSNNRFCYARAQVRDRLPLASKSKTSVTMTGNPNLTFVAAGFTVTRSAGSWITDGFAVGDVPVFAGTVSNNSGNKAITALTATVMTFASGVVNEGPVGGVTVTDSEGLVFAATTATRSIGSWLADGFRIGDSVTFAGTASNNATKVITALSATVLTYASGGVAETISSYLVTATKGETMATWVSLMDSGFASVDAQKRIDLGLGRGRVLSPITAWMFRRPCQWAFSIREYQHDLQIPAWRKSDGPFLGWDMQDVAGNNVVEFDERTNGGGLAARFTCFRTYGNGPNGTFGALSLTRMTEGSLLSRTHNLAVANLACTVAQAETENAIGQVLQLNPDGTGTDASLGKIAERVNSALQINLLQAKSEGPRASSATWSPSKTDVLSVPGAALTGVLDLRINGTLEQIKTTVRILNG
jgi:hypothetical protein